MQQLENFQHTIMKLSIMLLLNTFINYNGYILHKGQTLGIFVRCLHAMRLCLNNIELRICNLIIIMVKYCHLYHLLESNETLLQFN